MNRGNMAIILAEEKALYHRPKVTERVKHRDWNSNHRRDNWRSWKGRRKTQYKVKEVDYFTR